MKYRVLMILSLFLVSANVLFGAGKKPEKRAEFVRIDDFIRLEEYAPFRSSRLALLNREAALRLRDNLPRLDGDRNLFPVYASFVQAVYPKANYNFFRNRSLFRYYQFDSGFVRCQRPYDNLIEGEVDIVFCKGPSRFVFARAEMWIT